MNKLAKGISILMHPLLMPTYFYSVLLILIPSLAFPINSSFFVEFLSFTFVLTFIFPVISIRLLQFSGYISSMEVEERKERTLPLIFTTFFYGLVSYLFISRLNLNIIFQASILTMLSLIIINLIVNFFFKISAHAIGISGTIGLLIAINQYLPQKDLTLPIALLFVLLGLTLSARLTLKAHNLSEIITGCILGGIAGYGAIYLAT